jgi:drug/metabolite transporter (DMT)-like permease
VAERVNDPSRVNGIALNTPDTSSDRPTPVSAILLMLGAGVSFAFLDTSAKYLVLSGMSSEFVSWVRFAVHLLLVLVLFRAWANPAVFRYGSLPQQVLRGVFLFGSTFFNFYALKSLQLAETMSIAFFGPMVITALAGPLLGEWAGWRRWLAIGAGFVGVLFITRPGFGVFGLGHVFALASMFSYAFYAIMTRSMGARETSESLIFYSALAPVVLMAPIVPAYAEMPSSPLLWALLLSLGFYGAFGHYLLIRAFKQATATALAPYPYLQMVWMIFAGYVVFGDLPDGWTLFGAGIIVASGLYIVHREHRLRLASRTAPNTETIDLAKKL